MQRHLLFLLKAEDLIYNECSEFPDLHGRFRSGTEFAVISGDDFLTCNAGKVIRFVSISYLPRNNTPETIKIQYYAGTRESGRGRLKSQETISFRSQNVMCYNIFTRFKIFL